MGDSFLDGRIRKCLSFVVLLVGEVGLVDCYTVVGGGERKLWGFALTLSRISGGSKKAV